MARHDSVTLGFVFLCGYKQLRTNLSFKIATKSSFCSDSDSVRRCFIGDCSGKIIYGLLIVFKAEQNNKKMIIITIHK